MNADSTFQIGKDHTVCEDYAIACANNQAEFACAIVCDGCSASPEVDFGARVLAKSAEWTILFNHSDPLMTPRLMGTMIAFRAQKIFDVLPILHSQCLDATLLAAWVSEKSLTAYMFGDGVLIHRSKDAVKMVHVHLTSGAPDYLSYHLDNGRRAAYDKLVGNKKEVWTSYDGIHDYKPFEPFVYKCPVEEGDVISLISDGINSFRKSDNEAIDWKDLVDEFTGFKNFEGQFVGRRIAAFKRKFTKENWHHLDDISIASITV